jgi:hypothetical protein
MHAQHASGVVNRFERHEVPDQDSKLKSDEYMLTKPTPNLLDFVQKSELAFTAKVDVHACDVDRA